MFARPIASQSPHLGATPPPFLVGAIHESPVQSFRNNCTLGQKYRNKSLRDLELIYLCVFLYRKRSVAVAPQLLKNCSRRRKRTKVPFLLLKEPPHYPPDGHRRFCMQQRVHWSKKGDGYCAKGKFLPVGLFGNGANRLRRDIIGAIRLCRRLLPSQTLRFLRHLPLGGRLGWCEHIA